MCGLVSGASMETMRDGLLKVMSLWPKDYFGERALLCGEASDVTVVAESDDLECIVLSQDAFRQLGLLQKLRMPKRKPLRLPGFLTRGRTSRFVVSKTDEEMAAIGAALESSEALDEVLLPDRLLLRAMSERAKKRELAPDEVLVTPGTTEPCLYIVDSGCLAVSQLQDSAREELNKRNSMATRRMATLAYGEPLEEDSNIVEAGTCYGEHALLFEAPFTATVTSIGRSTVFIIGQAEFAESNRFVAEQRAEQNAALLDNVEIFSPLLKHEKNLIGRALVEVVLDYGHRIAVQGEVGDGLCILVEGEVSVVEDFKQKAILSADGDDVEYFGQEALAKPVALESPATITVVSESAKCLILSTAAMDASAAHQSVMNNAGLGGRRRARRQDSCWHWLRRWARCLGGIATASTSSWGWRSTHSSSSSGSGEGSKDEETKMSKGSKKLKLEDLVKVAILGKGAFGLVQLVEHAKTKELFALKKMKKARLMSSDVLKVQTMNEKNILQMSDSSFIIQLYKTFRTDSELIFLLEPALGGELYTIYWNEKLFGKQQHTQFYTASLVCALTHLHERYIIYRDLKPENVLLDAQGRLKLADMGLAKFIIGQTYTVCGTPCYLAPEAARQIGYSVAVDWWALGIVVWELLTGKTPFEAQFRGEVLHWLFTRKVLADLCNPSREWPRVFTEPAKDFLRAVLAYDPAQRVPMLPDGQQLLRANSWFDGLDWDALESGKLPPPYQPQWSRKKLSDLKNFRNDVTDEFDNEEVKDDGSQWDKDF